MIFIQPGDRSVYTTIGKEVDIAQTDVGPLFASNKLLSVLAGLLIHAIAAVSITNSNRES